MGGSLGVFGAVGMLVVYTGLMLAIVWKSFDMTAELKNWVFEWIGGSPRAMGENNAQQQHIMGVVGGAKSSMTQGASSAANKMAHNASAGGGNGGKEGMSNMISEAVAKGNHKQESNSEPKKGQNEG